MDIAFCIPAGRDMYAHEFAQLQAVTREQWRRQLTCTKCKNPASYRKASRDGRAACFVGTPHVAGCSLATIGDGSRGEGGTESEDERYNPGEHIVIDLRLDIEGAANAPGSTSSAPRHRGGRTFGAGDGFRRSQMHRKLRTLLRTLIHSDAFAASDQTIELTGEISLPAHRFFAPIASNRAPMDELHGFWGKLINTRLKDETIWLNTYGPVIPVDKDDLDVLLSIARVDELKKLTNAYVLVIGKKARSNRGKIYLAIKDLTRLAFITQP